MADGFKLVSFAVFAVVVVVGASADVVVGVFAVVVVIDATVMGVFFVIVDGVTTVMGITTVVGEESASDWVLVVNRWFLATCATRPEEIRVDDLMLCVTTTVVVVVVTVDVVPWMVRAA